MYTDELTLGIFILAILIGIPGFIISLFWLFLPFILMSKLSILRKRLDKIHATIERHCCNDN